MMAPWTKAWRILFSLAAMTVAATGTALAAPAGGGALMPTLEDFAANVTTGNRLTLTGIYAEDLFALPVVQQPYRMFVSDEPGTLTQFAWAWQYGVIGILAHNYLSGVYFDDLEIGDRLDLVYGDGNVRSYWVTDIQRYQAAIPESPNSQFIDLDTGAGTDATGLFQRVYMGGGHVTLQTCIAKFGNQAWGRLFVIAEPEPPLVVSWDRREARLDPTLPSVDQFAFKP